MICQNGQLSGTLNPKYPAKLLKKLAIIPSLKKKLRRIKVDLKRIGLFAAY